MKKTIISRLLAGFVIALPSVGLFAGMPTSSTGVTGSGSIGVDSSGSNTNTPEQAGQQHPTPNSGTIIDNAKPNDLPLENSDLKTRTTTDNPSAKISFDGPKKKKKKPVKTDTTDTTDTNNK